MQINVHLNAKNVKTTATFAQFVKTIQSYRLMVNENAKILLKSERRMDNVSDHRITLKMMKINVRKSAQRLYC
jgi:hypothetical protein